MRTLQDDVKDGCRVFTVQLGDLMKDHGFKHEGRIEMSASGMVYIFQADMHELPIENLEAKIKELLE